MHHQLLTVCDMTGYFIKFIIVASTESYGEYILQSAYSNIKSCVLFDGIFSPWFHVCQSVQQGGVLSPWLYVIYMNDLPRQLEQLNIGPFIHDEFYGCPMQADDVALIALTKNDLYSMMHVCYEYSRKWREQLTVMLD